jgi:light-regulated signal transduction histidine kinase (bacteriophytochrome)
MMDPAGVERRSLDLPNDDMQGFLDRMIHDLRESLRSVTIFSELLKQRSKEGSAGSDRDSAVDEVLGGATRMRTLIDGISEYAVARYRDDSASGASLDLALRAVVNSLGAQIQACGGKVAAGPLPRVGAGLECLIKLLNNLIGNALRFRGDQPPSVQVSALQGANREWTVRVQDNGIGIEPENIEGVFTPFTRLQGHKYPGAGLGLSICRLIVERHGGRIWAESGGGGSTFFFTLPPAEE